MGYMRRYIAMRAYTQYTSYFSFREPRRALLTMRCFGLPHEASLPLHELPARHSAQRARYLQLAMARALFKRQPRRRCYEIRIGSATSAARPDCFQRGDENFYWFTRQFSLNNSNEITMPLVYCLRLCRWRWALFNCHGIGTAPQREISLFGQYG